MWNDQAMWVADYDWANTVAQATRADDLAAREGDMGCYMKARLLWEAADILLSVAIESAAKVKQRRSGKNALRIA